MNVQGREHCGRSAPTDRIWPKSDDVLRMLHCEAREAEYERTCAGRQAPTEL